MTKITVDQIKSANASGLSGDYLSYYTPSLNCARILGNNGIDLSACKVVSGRRYGKAPDSYISTNYAENKSELGLSLMALDGDKDNFSVMFMGDRKVYHYTGLLLPIAGSDGEPLILCLESDDLDS